MSAAQDGPDNASTPRRRTGAAAALVAAGILLSRIAGFLRERAFAHVFGNSEAADVFRAAFRIPNLLQNLLGEGALSASFIPAYAKLVDAEPDKARRLAGVVLGLLVAASALLVALGVATAPFLVDAIAPGFEGDKRELAVRLVRVLFPAMGVLVASAWCLGVLNSHRKFFASYAAPVAFNAVMIVVLLVVDDAELSRAVFVVAVAAVGGAVAQLVVQLPLVVPLVRGMRVSLDTSVDGARQVLRNFVPALVSRGVVQVSAYVESMLASWLPTGAVAALGYAQIVYTLPVSLFGMSVAASELPEMARDAGQASEAARAALADRQRAASRRVAFFVVPCAAAFLACGDGIAAVLFQTGRFGADDARLLWALLGASAVGLVASTQARLLSSTFFALGDTRTPLLASIARVLLGTGAGAVCALLGPRSVGLDPLWGAAGLPLGSSLGGIVELAVLFVLLRRAEVPVRGLPLALWTKLVVAAAAGAGLCWVVRVFVVDGALATHGIELHPALFGLAMLAPLGVGYGVVALVLGVEEARALAGRIARRVRR